MTVAGGTPRYSVEVGDPRRDRADVLAVAARNLPNFGAARYAKYYERNPFGAPLFWLAREASTGTPVGMIALYPSELNIGAATVRGGIAADFAVDAKHRGFGPALALASTLRAAVAESGLRYVYGTPNPASLSVYVRVGLTPVGTFVRYVRLLHTAPAVREYVRHPALANAASAVLDVAASVLAPERLRHVPRNLQVLTPATFDDSFARVLSACASPALVTGSRRVDVLNWRFETDAPEPPRRYAIFALAGTAGTVIAYLVYSQREGIRHVVDIGWLDQEGALDGLIGAFVRDSRRARVDAVSVRYLGARGDRLPRRLRAFGFLTRREERGLLAYVPGDDDAVDAVMRAESWQFLAGDADL
ncbi:MAG: GNAT family N-acetyltransferase [Thermoleophilia bacterium]|nr:GNAT family N-acetyltransferase [Thermoleophilia bacterium]